MKNRLIEKRPPALTGNAQADVRALSEYVNYLRDELNFILTLHAKEINQKGE